jgi:hypothetical protein
MAAKIGTDGAIYAGAASTGSTMSSTGALAFMDSWTLTPSIDMLDVTAYGSSFRDRAQGLKDWSVECSGTLENTSNQRRLLDIFEGGSTYTGEVPFKLFTTTSRTTKYWSGDGVISGGSVVSSVSDKVTVSFTLEGNGALTWTGA